jgi:hypothetical protein
VHRLIPLLPALLCAGIAAAQPAEPPPPTVQMTVAQAREFLAEAGRQNCLFEYSEPNSLAELRSIGWEPVAFCGCAEQKLFAALDDELTREVAAYLVRTQNKLKTAADVRALAAAPGMAEYVRLVKNAKGNCIYSKIRGR